MMGSWLAATLRSKCDHHSLHASPAGAVEVGQPKPGAPRTPLHCLKRRSNILIQGAMAASAAPAERGGPSLASLPDSALVAIFSKYTMSERCVGLYRTR